MKLAENGTYYWDIKVQSVSKRALTMREYARLEKEVDTFIENLSDGKPDN